MTYGILKFPNVAHGEFFTIGAFATYIISAGNQAFLDQSIVIGTLASGFIGVVSYVLIYRTLAKRGAGLVPLTVASIGWSLVLRYIINFYYTGVFLYNFTVPSKPALGGIINVSPLRLEIIIVALAGAIAFHSLLSYTKLGKAIRGTANNITLASASGINTEIVIIIVWFIGSAMAGLAGAFFGIDNALTSDMGFNIIIIGFAVVILGGIGSFYGSVLSSFVLAFAGDAAILLIFYFDSLSPLRIGSFVLTYDINASYSFVVAFLILALALIFLPGGLGSLNLSGIRNFFGRIIR